MKMRAIFLSFFVALLASGPALADDAAVVPGPGPQQLIEKVSQDLLREIDANRAALHNDPAKLRALVDRVVLPSFDAEYSARLVLGKYWRTATAQQRQRFVDAFIQSMMRKYGNALLEFTADRLVILPFKGDPEADRATVRTEVKRDNGTPVPVNYSLHATPKGWKAWDVTIEGISYIKNFRTDFGAEIEAKGLDAVIERLEAEGRENAEPATKAAG
ncbi:MAG: ABC transporter substrate-binding protein [Steroidobacteraceae bacterium]|nr:ABC transporter substrate-binding protein [Steroidobacteraceae bacterium]